jgi:hypothetical protein
VVAFDAHQSMRSPNLMVPRAGSEIRSPVFQAIDSACASRGNLERTPCQASPITCMTRLVADSAAPDDDRSSRLGGSPDLPSSTTWPRNDGAR